MSFAVSRKLTRFNIPSVSDEIVQFFPWLTDIQYKYRRRIKMECGKQVCIFTAWRDPQ